MKNALVIAGVFVGAVLAAILGWAVVGGDDGRRTAALVEPTQSGSIGELTIAGVQGATAMPVRSFNFGLATTQSVHDRRIEVLRDGGEASPELFRFGNGTTTAATATLTLREPGADAPYQSYLLNTAKLVDYRAGKHEKLALRYQTVEVTRGPAEAPAPHPREFVGYMTLQEQRVPILAFDSPLIHGDGPWFGAVIRRPLDDLAPTLKADLLAGTNLAPVRIDLQTREEEAPHVTYELESLVTVVAVTDSVAAGVVPTQEVELRFRRMRVSHGRRSTACYDALSHGHC